MPTPAVMHLLTLALQTARSQAWFARIPPWQCAVPIEGELDMAQSRRRNLRGN